MKYTLKLGRNKRLNLKEKNASKISAELNLLIIIFVYFLTWLYQLTVYLICKGFKSNDFDYILTSVGSVSFWSCTDTVSANQSLYLFWMNDFSTLFTDKSKDWNLLVRLWGTITTSRLFSPHSSFKGSLFWCQPWYLPSGEKLYLRKIPQISLY